MKIADFKQALGVDEQASWVFPGEHFSATQLNMLQVCPRQYQQRYILGRKEPPGAARVIGKAVHEAIGFRLAPRIEGMPAAPLKDVAEYLHDLVWPTILDQAEADIVWDEGQKPEDALMLAGQMIETYCKGAGERVEPSAIEREFKTLVPGVPIPLLGYVDISQRDHRPSIDIKTTKRAQKTMKPDWILQGRIYQIAERQSIDWHVVTKQTTPQVLTGLESPALMQNWNETLIRRTEEHIAKLAWLANAYYRHFGEEEDWPATGIAHDWRCDWCGYRNDCPAWEGLE